MYTIPALAKTTKALVILAAAALVLALFPAGLSADGTSLVLYYEFDEAEGGVIADLSGNGRDVRLEGAVLSAGKFGQAVEFRDGSQVVLPEDVMTGSEFSISAWVYWNGGSNLQRIFDFGLQEGTHLFMVPTGSTDTIRIVHRKGSSIDAIIMEDPLPTGQWVHIAVTIDSSAIIGYVNGEIRGTVEAPKNSIADVSGEINTIGNGKSALPFDGKLDRLAIYSKALTEAEVQSLASGSAPAASGAESDTGAVSEAADEQAQPPVTPAAMPQTGLGGTSPDQGASPLIWMLAGLAAAFCSIAAIWAVRTNSVR